MAGIIETRCGDPNGTSAVIKVRNVGMIDYPVTHMDVAIRVLGLLKQLFTEEDREIGSRENTITAERSFRYDKAVFEVYVRLTTYRPITNTFDPYGVFAHVEAYLLQASTQVQHAVQSLQTTPTPGTR